MWSHFVSLPKQLQQSALLGQLSIDFNLGRGAGKCICMGMSVEWFPAVGVALCLT